MGNEIYPALDCPILGDQADKEYGIKLAYRTYDYVFPDVDY